MMSDNCEKSLEPVGQVEAETFETECSRGVVKFGAGDGLEELPEGTPLFTASEIRHRLELMLYTPLDEDETMTQRVSQMRKELGEFTQNGDSSE